MRELYGRLVDDDRPGFWKRLFGGSNGRHRQAPEAASGDTPDGAGPSDAGAGSAAPAWHNAIVPGCITYVADLNASARTGASHPGAQGGMSGGVPAGYGQLMGLGMLSGGGNVQQPNAADLWRLLGVPQRVQWSTIHSSGTWDVEPAPPIEDAGITVGEIIAWRSWKVKNGLLTSMYRDEHIWPPHEPITGDPNAPGHTPNTNAGVHAFKSEKAALEYAAPSGASVIVGRVKLWGEVIEHDKGYRVEYAKVHSLDVPLGVSDEEMNRLRALYLKP